MPTHTYGVSWTQGTESVQNTVSVTADLGKQLDVAVAANQTNYEVDYTLDVSSCKGLYISSDVAMTVKTNSSGSPDQTITLTANTPVIWYTGIGATCPITTDVTKLYVTNTTAGTLKVRSLEDVTPA